MSAIRYLRLMVLVIAAVLTIEAETWADETKPNILLIMADDMGYECVGANGGGSYQTPTLDALSRRGLRFTRCHSQPICTPSRVQIMTGIYNHRNYIEFGLLDSGAVTFANLLQQQGYATCVAGKWQLKGGLKGPHGFGFDEYCLWQLTRRRVGIRILVWKSTAASSTTSTANTARTWSATFSAISWRGIGIAPSWRTTP